MGANRGWMDYLRQRGSGGGGAGRRQRARRRLGGCGMVARPVASHRLHGSSGSGSGETSSEGENGKEEAGQHIYSNST